MCNSPPVNWEQPRFTYLIRKVPCVQSGGGGPASLNRSQTAWLSAPGGCMAFVCCDLFMRLPKQDIWEEADCTDSIPTYLGTTTPGWWITEPTTKEECDKVMVLCPTEFQTLWYIGKTVCYNLTPAKATPIGRQIFGKRIDTSQKGAHNPQSVNAQQQLQPQTTRTTTITHKSH